MHKIDEMSRRWRSVLLAYFMRRVRDHAEAEDLTQELLLKLVQHKQSSIVSPDAYIFQMASNLLVDRARRYNVRAKYRQLIGQGEDRAVDVIDPFRITAGRSQLTLIANVLAELPERTRTIFILYRLESIGQQAIADTFGISVSAVKKHVARAMCALVQVIEVSHEPTP